MFETLEICPDVLDTPPEGILEATYGDASVNAGNVLTPTQVRTPPTHLAWSTETESLYTFLMTDPDAPSRSQPTFREWHHYLVVNIPGNAIDEGQTVAEYIGAAPPPETGLHRYIFLAFRQNNRIEYTDPLRTNRSADGRGSQSTRALIEKYNLGKCVAGNCFQAEFDDIVPTIYQELSGG